MNQHKGKKTYQHDIVVVDDSLTSLQFLTNILEEHGYRVRPASNGVLALKTVAARPPELILLDVKMPDMDGFEVCRRLKSDAHSRNVPVIFISALGETAKKVEGFKVGAVDFITKPFQTEEVLARVRIHLDLRELTDDLERMVAERTEKLHAANMQLKQELAIRKQAEQALRESRLRLDNIIANSPCAIYRCANDPEWTMEFLSAAITLITGYPADDFLNNRVRSYASIIHPDDRRSVADAVAAGLERRDRYEMEYRLVAVDGSLRWVHEQGRGVFAPGGQPVCLDGFIADITAQRQAEELSRLNAERMETMLRLNQMGDAPLEEMMTYACEAAVRLTRSKLGYFAFMNEDETVLTMQYWSSKAMAECRVPAPPKIYPVETTGLWGEAVRQRRPIITNDYAAPSPWKKCLPEGHVRLTRHMNLPVIAGGKIVLVAGVANKEEEYTEIDVQQLTLLMQGMWLLIESKRAEEALHKSEEKYRTLFENVNEGFALHKIIVDESGVPIDYTFLEINSAFEAMTGLERAKVIGKTAREILPGIEKDPADWIGTYGKVAMTGVGINFENYSEAIGRWYQVNAFSPKAGCFAVTFTDVTERKAAEEALRRLNLELDRRVLERTAELEAANKEMHAFTYTVSHDLRAPLRHIDGFLELLQKKAGAVLDGQSRHYMDTISKAARKMGLLIDDLLSFSRMGRHAVTIRPVDLGNLLREVIGELEPDAAGRTIEWRIGGLPAVDGDAAMLRIVLVNLISNALKFTWPRQEARIEIGSIAGQTSETVIFIRDNGVGFDMAYVDKLFGVFQRLHRAEEFEGTGIGLATVRRIITRHGGRTWAEGELNQGAVFYFSLPQAVQGALT
jgi:PAS domain S-box-containing protein